MDIEEINLDDDDYVVLVVGDENEDINFAYIKKELKEEEQETLHDESLEDTVPENNYYLKEYCEEDYVIEDQQISENDKTNDYKAEETVSERPKSHWKCVPNEYQYSYVEELRKQNPEYRNDECKLVAKVVEVMKNCVPEDPPEDFLTPGTLKCTICDSESRTIGEAKRHYQWRHGPRYLTCYSCGSDYRSPINLTKHEKKCKGVDAHIVLKARAICVGRRGFNRPYLDESIREGTSVKKVKKPTGLPKAPKGPKKQYRYPSFKCDECSAVFKMKQSLLSHQNLHKGLTPFRCDQCPMAYTSKMGLKHHKRLHSPALFVCDLCGNEYHYKNAIVSHMNAHLPRLKFACTFPGCDRRFSQRTTLKVHTDVDHCNLPLPFGCDFCDKRCRRMTHLKEHMLKVHGMTLMTRTMFVRSLPKIGDVNELESKVWIHDGGADESV